MRKLIFVITIFMFFFKTSTTANYEQKIYDFTIESITGETIDFKDYKNKVILIVNTASYCGFTKQYDELQELWDLYKDKGLIVTWSPV
jgi:glutathione peroxidase